MPRLHLPPRQPDHTRASQSAIATLIDTFNPGVTMLVALWVFAFETRKRLLGVGPLGPNMDYALQSLILVIPIMLVGWGVLHVVDRRFRLGLFR